MLTFELIHKKRKPIKIWSISGIALGILLILLIAVFGDRIVDSMKIVIMGISAILFVIGLFILSYSYNFKEIVGHVSFEKEYIELEYLQLREVIDISQIQDVRLKLNGYEGLNKTILQGLYDLSYRSGINNFVFIQAYNHTRKFEFYISNQKDWVEIQRIANYYQEIKNSKK